MSDNHYLLRKRFNDGARIQANRGTDENPHWVTLDDPQFTCEPELYRVHPEDENDEALDK